MDSRNKILSLLLFGSLSAFAQVGIGTTAPAATLDVTATNLTGSTVDGFLVPRVSRLRAQTMTGMPTSTLIFVNDVSTGTASGTTVNVTTTGFYFYNGTAWEKLATGATNAWAVTGNSGLSGTTNFMGTTDNVDVAFRRNNGAAGKIGATSTAFGVNALNAGAATNNAAFGTNALVASTGADNVAVGNGTLAANTTGIQNTGIGNAALALNTGSASTAVGFQALNKNTASNNSALGFQALANATTAIRNTAVGFQTAAALTTGGENTAMGFQALGQNSTGGQNTAVGNFTLGRNTGLGNTAMGHEAEFGSSLAFNYTTAIGWHALFNNSGNNNTAVGYNALQGNLTTIGNTAVGSAALNNNTGSNNTALGTSAGFEHGSGDANTYVGFEAGRYNVGASNNNAFFGYQAGLYSQGNYNTAIGSNTLKANSATSNNVAIGYNALNTNMGTGNVAIGYSAASAETGSNKLYIENSSANANNALIYGEFDTNIARVNGTLQINNPATANGYALPNVRGTNGQVLTTDGVGGTSWTTPSATAFSMVRANLGANQVMGTSGWQKINLNMEAFDTASEFSIATGRFTATKAGFYRINGAFHTNVQNNNNQYSVGIYVNGSLYQQTASDHYGIGMVERNVTCLVQLGVGDYVELYMENFVSGVQVDAYSGKTVLEIQQVR